MRGNPWGCAKWPKWAKMASIGKIMKKMMKKNYGVPNFLHKNNALILHPPHYAGKKCKNALGRPMGVHKRGKSHFSILGLWVAWGRGGDESVMALTGFLLLDIIARVPSDKVFVNWSGDEVMGSPISRHKWWKMAKNNKKFHFQANGGVIIAWSSSLSIDIIVTAPRTIILVNKSGDWEGLPLSRCK